MLVSIVVPMFNEEHTAEALIQTVSTILKKNGFEFEILCINDGSQDSTLEMLKTCKVSHPEVRIVNLSRNFGKECALTAGLDKSVGDVVIPMDADLQDPPELMLSMIERHKEGFDVVLAKRNCRKSDSKLKRYTAKWFYKLIRKVSHVDIPENVGDFRLMSRRVVDTLKELKETQRFMKGVLAWPGFSTCEIEYTRRERYAGKTSFNYISLTNLAIEGITSFSVAPLKLASIVGIFLSTAAFLFGIYIFVKTLVFGIEQPGYASIMVVLLFISGVQFSLIGILGEYLGRVYMEVKKRPLYIIEDEY